MTINGKTFVREGTRAVVAEGMAAVAVKYNPHHDSAGRFASGSGGGMFSTPPPGIRSNRGDPTAKPSFEVTVEAAAPREASFAKFLDKPENAHVKQAVTDYATGDFGSINGLLRGTMEVPEGGPHIEKTRGQIAALDTAIQQHSLPVNTILYRGVSADALRGLGRARSFVDDGYTSTTYSRGEAEGFAKRNKGRVLKIVAPAGTNAAWLEGFRKKGEMEVVLPRGTRYDYSKLTDGTYGWIAHAP